MDFLTSLYSNENFGIILFTSVSILVLAFLVILFFGKKDQKKRELTQTNNKEANEVNIDHNVELNANAFNNIAKENEEFFSAQRGEELNPIGITNDTSEINEGNDTTNEMINEVPVPPKSDFDFDALAASISKELESIGINSEDTFIAEPNDFLEKNEDDEIIPEANEDSVSSNIHLYEPPKQMEPEIEVKIAENDLTYNSTDSDVTLSNPNSNQFSSVYVNNDVDETVIEQSTVPPIELPKKIELPKLNSENSEKMEQETQNMMFTSLENEIPSYEEENRM